MSSKGRNLSNLIAGDGKIDSSEIAQGAITSASLSEDIEFSGAAIAVPSGTSADRPETPKVGSIRYNTETGLTENYNSVGWQGIDAPPSVYGISGIINEDTNSVITITGSNFKPGAIVYVDGAAVNGISRPLVTTYIASNELQANTNASNQSFTGAALYSINVVNSSGLSGSLDPAGIVDRDPVWTTASGNIANFEDRAGADSVTIAATDPDGDTVSYDLDTSSTLPSGLALDSNSGTISGDPDDVSNTTTYPFTINAVSNSQVEPRLFNITITKSLDGSSADRAAVDSTHSQIINKPSGWFHFDNLNGGTDYGYVYNDYDGGGWLNVMSIDSSAVPGHSYAGMWDDTGFWTGTTNYGTGNTSLIGQFYKPWAWNKYSAFNEIMIQVLDGSGNILGYGVYDRLSGFNGQSWYDMMSPGTRQVITNGRKAQSGDSGAGHNWPQSTVYGFPFTDTGKQGCTGEAITINDQNAKFSADTSTKTRIGTTASSDSPTNRGHVVAGGMGVFHRHGSWYGGHVVGPHMDYCTNSGAGQGHRNWGNNGSASNNTWNWYGASSWADGCITESNQHPTKIVRIYVR